MRFISGGPIIPDSLLSERDAGRVVFFCGAGISIASGMPSFTELTEYVIERVTPPKVSEIRMAFSPWVDPNSTLPVIARTPLDQIFNLLQAEYGRDKISSFVSERLSVIDLSKSEATEHKIISRISTNEDGNPQIVTTNFDRLFEVANNSVRIYEPPGLCDIQHDVPLTGLTYLHGRLPHLHTALPNYILSSSDFGRAYLAQAWATSFIKHLLQKYTVVLLGYSAEDPPVKYLLQGLNLGQDHSRERLFAFDEGEPDEIEAKWRGRGVTPIAYSKSEKHQSLWDTLDAWATRSDNPAAWKSSIIDLARKGPKALKPYQRGMVTHLVRSSTGAKKFAEADPVLPIDWLFVFDKTCRFAKVSKNSGENNEEFNSLEAFGLDDDPPRPQEVQQDAVSKIEDVEDIIGWRYGDDSQDYTQRLTRTGRNGFDLISSRLFHLARWLVKHEDQTALAWWAARQNRLHPRLSAMLRNAIAITNRITDDARAFWEIIFSAHEDNYDDVNLSWYSVLANAEKNGWSKSAIREMAAVTEPKFNVSHPYGISESSPPIDNWESIEWSEIASIEIHFPSMHGEYPEVPNEAIPSVYEAFQRNIILASDRLSEAKKQWFELQTFYPENPEINRPYLLESDAYLEWFLHLLNRMSTLKPKLLRSYIDTWPAPESRIFDKLRLYVWNKDICQYQLAALL